jgi:4-hydroxythreonine-4-phosphate dehydrogenase
MTCKRLLVTLGDPNGLGPELIVRLLNRSDIVGTLCDQLVLIGPVRALDMASSFGQETAKWQPVANIEDILSQSQGVFLLTPDGCDDIELTPGVATPDGGMAAGLALETACQLMKTGVAQGLVTCPLNKAMLQQAGFVFQGHTEFLAHQFDLSEDEVCMHLAGPQLRVSLVTTHPPLRNVPDLINGRKIVECLRMTQHLLSALGILDSPIGVCGLNPHAGESGHIGWEEKEIIVPAIVQAKEQGISVEGPFPADTLFYHAARQKYSAVLAMYHDQGLAPLKLLHFGQAVNITLGLPVVRTSVDHGTGYELVGQGTADLSSLYQALRIASRLVDHI